MYRRGISAILALLCFTVSAFSQGTTSRLLGVVTDASGAAVVNANVTLTNEGTSTAFAATTGANGAYAFEAIQPGTYASPRP